MKRDFSVSRRSFLRSLVTAVATVAVVEPVVETAKTFLPPAAGWKTEAFVTPEWLSREALLTLESNLVFKRSYEGRIADQNGFSVRFVKEYEISTEKPPSRFDVIYGVGCIAPNTKVRLVGADGA